VMAVVSGGLFLASQSHRIFTPGSRWQGNSTWATVDFIFDGLVFIRIGLQLPGGSRPGPFKGPIRPRGPRQRTGGCPPAAIGS
jgi:NhaP-type Na+/H+ or K+/H+ antiporter